MTRLLLCLAILASAPAHSAETTLRVFAELEWTALNPARGDASPRAANLWGDRAGAGPSGFLVKFADGFSSPPHIHNVTCRAVVISGEVHNDDAGAAPMWMGPGSFWAQPRSESHVTASRGPSMVYVEIEEGPYLVHPAEQAEPVAEKPINIDASNLVWTASKLEGVQVSRLWGAPDSGGGGVMVRLRPGAATRLEAGDTLHAVVVSGAPKVGPHRRDATPGTLISGRTQRLDCGGADDCVLYVRTTRRITFGG